MGRGKSHRVRQNLRTESVLMIIASPHYQWSVEQAKNLRIKSVFIVRAFGCEQRKPLLDHYRNHIVVNSSSARRKQTCPGFLSIGETCEEREDGELPTKTWGPPWSTHQAVTGLVWVQWLKHKWKWLIGVMTKYLSRQDEVGSRSSVSTPTWGLISSIRHIENLSSGEITPKQG